MRYAVDETVNEEEEELLTVVLLPALKHGVHLFGRALIGIYGFEVRGGEEEQPRR